MAKVNTYGLTINGLKAASGETRNYSDRALYDELFYDRAAATAGRCTTAPTSSRSATPPAT